MSGEERTGAQKPVEQFTLHERLKRLDEQMMYLRGLVATLVWDRFPRDEIESLLQPKDVEMIARLVAELDDERRLATEQSKENDAMDDDFMTTLREMIEEALSRAGETWGDIIYLAIKDTASLDKEIDAGYGYAQAAPFTAWTERNVYFPAEYDGNEWVTWVPRNPCDETTRHVGGE